eukprot:2639775-Ditylum_brightwellii.AAC.1
MMPTVPQPPMVPHTYNPNMMGSQYQQFLQMMGALRQNFPGQNFVTQQQQGHSGIPGAKWYANHNYCWTHGCDIADNHTSQSCRQTAPGHIWIVSRQHLVGGSMKDCHKIWMGQQRYM